MMKTEGGPATWNGPICPICGARYLGQHQCSDDDIWARVFELMDHLRDRGQGA